MADPWTSERQARIAPPDLWDPLVRISHWGIAFIVVMNALLTKGGSPLHLWLGWIGMALLLLRLVWGVLGPVEARFSALVSGRAPQYRSHNPAGALMVYAFWVTLAVVIGTGLLRTGGQTPMAAAREDAAVASGDWSVLVTETDGGGESRFGTLPGEVHTVAANLLLILAALHVAGVAVESRAMRRNLVAPMLTGSKRRRG
ncbi:MAG: cytochrome B [Rhodobacterales bacterium 17-64-5]|nr:MAG: cytochrome B [Rhodobacterales bacterium 17-64-5]